MASLEQIAESNLREPNVEVSRMISRRDFIGATSSTVALASLDVSASQAKAPESVGDFSFLIVSDTHLLASEEQSSQIDPPRFALIQRLIQTLNQLPGTSLPESLGGGRVQEPLGVIHLGDMIDSGDKSGARYLEMSQTEWQHHVALFGLQGQDGALRYPIYEIHGNHDSQRLRNVAIEGVIDRNRHRSGLIEVSANGLHTCWKWGGVFFIALGIVVGPNEDDLPISRYDSFESLGFLKAMLSKHVGDSGRPVVLLHHIDLLRYSRPCDPLPTGGDRQVCCNGMATVAWCDRGCEGAKGISRDEWSHCDVAAYGSVIQSYNVAAIFHGHLHARRTDQWPIQNRYRDTIPVFGCKNSGAGGEDRAIFYVHCDGKELVIAEYRSLGKDGWDSHTCQLSWTPEHWRATLAYRP